MGNPFDPNVYGPVVSALLQKDRLIELGPGNPDPEMEKRLAALQVTDLFPSLRILDPPMAQACLAGLWLYHDFLHQSHRISQSIPTATGSYWHGLMHRREPDYSNAKYWFRKVGNHPVFSDLCREAKALADSESRFCPPFIANQDEWNPFDFIDFCEECLQVETPAEHLCRKIQQREWELLFDYCYKKAVW